MKKIGIGAMLGGIFFILSVIGGINSASALTLPTSEPAPAVLPGVDFNLTLAASPAWQILVEEGLKKFLEIPAVGTYIGDLIGQAGVTGLAVDVLAKAMALKLRNQAESWEAANAKLSKAIMDGDVQGLLAIAVTVINGQPGSKSVDVTHLTVPQVSAKELSGVSIASIEKMPLDYLEAKLRTFIVINSGRRPAEDAADSEWDKEFLTFVESLGYDKGNSDIVKSVAVRTVEAQTGKDPSVNLEAAEKAIEATTGRMKAFLEAAL